MNRINSTILQPIADYLKYALRNELVAQGHKATEELIKSIEVVVNDVSGGFEIVGRSIYYGRFVDQGRKPGLKGVPIDALIKWISVRNIKIQGMNERSMAFMFQASIKKKGIKPSNFVQHVLDEYKNKISNEVEKIMYTHTFQLIENMITKTLKIA